MKAKMDVILSRFGWSIFFLVWSMGCMAAAYFFPPQRGFLAGIGVLSLGMCVFTFAQALAKKGKE